MIRWITPIIIAVASPLGVGAAPIAEAEQAGQAAAPSSAAAVANWVISSGDNRGLPFLIVDKLTADVAVFDEGGHLRGRSPALVGMARGDVVVADIGNRPFAKIISSEKITEAGRFFAQFGPSEDMPEVLWLDYKTSLSLHPVITSNPSEKRLERLMSESSDDNRVTFGCINISEEFYRSIIKAVLSSGVGIVYVVPEVRRLGSVFPGFEGKN